MGSRCGGGGGGDGAERRADGSRAGKEKMATLRRGAATRRECREGRIRVVRSAAREMPLGEIQRPGTDSHACNGIDDAPLQD